MRVFFLFTSLLVWETSTLAKEVEGPSTQCIQSLKELEGNPKIREIVDYLGGKENLLGSWTFEGRVMGFQKKMTLELFTLGEDGILSGKENGESVGKMKVCLADKPNTLRLETSKKIILVRKGKEDGTIQISQVMRLVKTPFYAFIRATDGGGGAPPKRSEPYYYIRPTAVATNGHK